MFSSTVTSKGQITIPKDVRATLGLEPGDKINFIIDDKGNVNFSPVTENITDLKGVVDKPLKPVSIDDMKKTIKNRGSKV